MSGFLSSFKKLFRIGGEEFSKRKAPNKNIVTDVDPLGHWEILGELGDGAFGKVYKAQRKDEKTFAALKQVEIKGEEDLDDFTVEINILSECKHKNVVGLHEAFFFDGKLSMFIEFCGGGALDSIMVDLEKSLSEDQIRYVLHEMCLALDFIHQHKVIHRDLKAGNVLLTMDGEVKLADFGVSAKNTKTVQRRDTFIGTPYWMAPEVILCETLKDTPYDYKADIWSLGVTAIEFAQIEPPNHDMHPMRVLIKIQKSDPPGLDKPSLWSRAFNDFISKCLQKSPQTRPSALELLEHHFIKDATDKKPILDLILEAKADVVETVTDLTEEEDIKEIKRHMSDDSQSIDLDSLSTYSGDTDKPEEREKSVEKEAVKDKTPEREKTPDREKTPSPVEEKAPSPVKEKSPSPEKEKSPSPVREKSPEPSQQLAASEDDSKKAPSPKKSPAPPPPGQVSTPGEPTTSLEEPVPSAAGEVRTEEKDENDRSSDEGIGPSGDERSDGSQTESPAKTTVEETEPGVSVKVAGDIAEDIIDDVIKSTRVQPSVPSVVFDTIQDMTETQMEEEELAAQMAAAEGGVIVASTTSDTTVTSSTSDTTITSPTADTAPVADVKTDTKEKTEVEVQEVKVKVPGSDAQLTENGKDVITINGQPVPEAGAIVINGHATVVKESDVTEVESGTVTVPEALKDDSQKRQSVIPQTDLDTFETKMTSDGSSHGSMSVNFSNPDDDLSDKKSETGSANTEGSLEREESKKIDNNIQRRKKLRERNESKSHYRTMTKTRTYLKDGKYITTTTSKVVAAGEENKAKEEHNLRKQDLRELKLLQKQENKQYQDLMYKAHVNRETQEKKFEADMQNLVKNFDQDMDTLTKQQKQQVEKAEVAQANDMKNAARKIKTEQEKEVKIFKEQQKQELKLLKQELDLLPRDGKKEAMRKRKEAKEIELTDKERLFLENQQERMDKHMKQLGDQHRQKIALLESQFLQQKQQLLRAREAAIWEMEKEQLHEKHQLAKGQLKEMFFLKRHQMLTRHQKEIEQMKRYNTAKEDEMKDRHSSEKRRLPKILRNEAKTRAQMFKQSLRLSTISTPDDDKMKIKQFEENEKKRMKAEQQRQEAKHKKQWEELVFRNETALKELEQLQAEKRKMLMEQETLKIKELEKQYESELKDWKAQLVPRKQKLEEEFARQRDEQDKFYGAYVTGEADPNHPVYSRSSQSQGSVRSREDTIRSRHSTVI